MEGYIGQLKVFVKFFVKTVQNRGSVVAEWIRRSTQDRKVLNSNPAPSSFFCNFILEKEGHGGPRF